MKVLAKILCVVMFVAVIAGCASNRNYVPPIPPKAQAVLMDYYEQPDNKVFVIAVDPNGDFAYGYDYGRATKEEAFRAALEQCNASREDYGILNGPNVYAINDTVVYESSLSKTRK